MTSHVSVVEIIFSAANVGVNGKTADFTTTHMELTAAVHVHPLIIGLQIFIENKKQKNLKHLFIE